MSLEKVMRGILLLGGRIAVGTAVVAGFSADMMFGPYATPYVWLVLLCFALVVVLARDLRRARFTGLVRRWCTCLMAIVGVLWLVTLATYFFIPIGPRNAIAFAGGGAHWHWSEGLIPKPFEFRCGFWERGMPLANFGSSTSFWPKARQGHHSVPFWPLLFVLAVPTAALWVARPKPLPPGLCAKCSYDLTGNVSGVCPECGTAVPPSGP